MCKISILIGTGYYGEDIMHKLPWIEKMENHEFFIASRIHPDIHLNPDLTNKSLNGEFLNQIRISVSKLQDISKFNIIYESEHFDKKYTEKSINELEEWLGISFKYIGSLDRRFYNKESQIDSRNENELNQYIASLVEFFKTFFLENKIDIFINTIEDDVFSSVAYYTAKKLNIEILGLMWGRFPRKGIIFCKDYTEICCWNENEVKLSEIEDLYSKPTIAHEDIMIKNQDHLKFISIIKRIQNSMWVINYNKFVKTIEKLINYEKFIFEKTSLFKEIKKYFKKLTRKFLIKLVLDDIDNNENYFLFPLHITDDAQLTFREPFVNQFTLIKDLARVLPENHFLYIKPHPHYLGTDVKFSDIRKLRKIKGIKLINPIYSPIDLIKNSKAVITINSTTGFESLVMKTPVISFGHDFYCKEDLCYIIRDFNDLPQIVNKVSSTDFKSDKNTKRFLKNVYMNTIWIETMNLDGVLALTDTDGSNIAKSLDKILEKN
ncbi:MAG: hypothetical protein Q8R66_12660 [Methanobacteriaceae archaeon]|nr:hypothetical protein [Methanobacteriaceae archaeon]